MWRCLCFLVFRIPEVVPKSTTEPEYVAMAETSKEVLFLKQVWCFMLTGAGPPCVSVFVDNEDPVRLA